ncbi:glycosyltransferase family A protein [candidate division CSSED10-310 bacterium]|uniref:Glycosyltransferase family A protein n=1 Tax=candidate division CSSED10-310 bacterium TaxID=2855610 RepID=A0ABV6YXN0_UNCC1
MISIVIYTHNDEQTIEWCLDSLRGQQGNRKLNVVVLDDNSSDNTAAVVAQRFPEFCLFKENLRYGWIGLLRKHLPAIGGEVIAFLGAHCRAHHNWISALEHEMTQGQRIITGRGYHGKQHLLKRFEAASIHADFISEVSRTVTFLWDDNFAITHKLLREALPQTDAILSDGAGAALLSLHLQKMGVPIQYCPQVKIDHITHSIYQIIEMWSGEIAINAIAIKLADPSLPGAQMLRLGPIIAAAFALNRFRQGIGSLLSAHSSLKTSWFESGIHMFLLALLMPVYYVGLCREMYKKRDLIWS